MDQNNLKLMEEAQKRGILPPEQSAMFDEAKKRGLVKLDAMDTSAMTPEIPSAAVKVGRGMMDLYQGVKQLGLIISDAFTGKKDADVYTKQVGKEIANYERGRGGQAKMGQTIAGNETISAYQPRQPAAFDWFRLAGNILNPTVLAPASIGGNLATKTVAATATGAGVTGLMFNPEGESRAEKMALGGTVAGAIPGGAQLVTGAARKGVNASADLISRSVGNGMNTLALTQQLEAIVSRAGGDWVSLNPQIQESLRSEAVRQLAVGNLNPDALVRVARAQMLDPRLQLTRGQATRAPADWQTEQNLRGIQVVGDDLRTRFGEQGQILGEQAERLRGTNVTPYQAGDRAVSTIQQKARETGDEVSALYTAARDTVGAQANVPLGPMHIRAMAALNDFDDVIPSPIKARLEALGIGRMGPTKATKAFTVEEAEALDKLINRRWDASNRPLTAALGQIKGAIRESLDSIGDEVGADAAAAFRVAKGRAAERFDEFGQRIAKAASDDVAPDKFVRKFVVNGDVRDITSLVRTLTTGSPEQIIRGNAALGSIRAATLTELFERNGALADGVLSGAKLDRALKDIGPERIRAIFTPAQVQQLELLRRVSLDLTKPPPLADINYSRTAGALANLLGSISKVPGLGFMGKMAQGEIERGQAKTSAAALRGVAKIPRQPLEIVSEQGQNALARRITGMTVPPVNALMYQENQ